MTKTLTEQWREGTLTGGFYYIQLKGERWPLIDHTDYNLLSHKIEWKDFDWRAVEEVIEEVPSYEEHIGLVQEMHILKKKLEIATKALKEIEECTKEFSLPSYTGMLCYKALKEMGGVK